MAMASQHESLLAVYEADPAKAAAEYESAQREAIATAERHLGRPVPAIPVGQHRVVQEQVALDLLPEHHLTQ